MTSGSGNRAAAIYRANAGRWLKKDVRSLCSQIDSFVLSHERYRPKAQIRDAIERNRPRIVCDGLRGFRAMIDERLNGHTGYAASAEHARTSGVWGSATAEMVARFEAGAAECRAAIAKIDALIARVEAEGLPPDVAGYMPARAQD